MVYCQLHVMAYFTRSQARIISLLLAWSGLAAAHISAIEDFTREQQQTRVAQCPSSDDTPEACYCDGDNYCPPWYVCHDGLCQCSGVSKFPAIKCNNNNSSSSSSVLQCNCVTSDSDTGKTYAGQCVYNCGSLLPDEPMNNAYHPLPCNLTQLTEFMCGQLNRTGRMCGYCKDGLRPYVLSYNLSCVECQDAHKNWWKFFLIGFAPLTCFYFFVVIFHINITSSRMQSIVLFSQIISVPANYRLVYLYLANHKQILTAFKVLGIFHTFWNLDFFLTVINGVCLDVDPLLAHALEYLVAVYPLVLILLTVKLYDHKFRLFKTLCKPVSYVAAKFHSNWDVRTSMIDSFSTFFLLSFVKVLTISFDLLIFTEVFELGSNNTSRVLYFEPSVGYFSKEHLPYGILAITLLSTFIVTPVSLLILYPLPCFQKFLCFFRINWHFLHTFVDSFQGCFKDGTEPRDFDCRWMSAYGLIIRLMLFVVYSITTTAIFYVYAVIVLVLLIMLLINVEPYKRSMAYLSLNDVTFVILLTLMYTGVIGTTIQGYEGEGLIFSYIIAIISATFSVCYTVILASYWIVSKRKQIM